MSDAGFTHDVFLSHSAKDKAVVRPLAERLHAKVEVRRKKEEMELQPLLCALGSDWARLACFGELRGSALGQSVPHPPGAHA